MVARPPAARFTASRRVRGTITLGKGVIHTADGRAIGFLCHPDPFAFSARYVG